MSDQLTDPLNFTIEEGLDTSIPLLPESDYELQISDSEFKKNEKLGVVQWNPRFATTAPTLSSDGVRTVPPNTILFIDWSFNLGDKEGEQQPGRWKKDLCKAFDAIYGTNDSNRPSFGPKELQETKGRKVVAHVIIDTYEGNSRNKVKASSLKAAQ